MLNLTTRQIRFIVVVLVCLIVLAATFNLKVTGIQDRTVASRAAKRFKTERFFNRAGQPLHGPKAAETSNDNHAHHQHARMG